MVTASLTTPAIVTVTALVTDISIYSVKTCKETKLLKTRDFNKQNSTELTETTKIQKRKSKHLKLFQGSEP